MSMPTDMQAFNRGVVEEFRANGGRIAEGMLAGADLVLLTTTGRRSGAEHTVPLGYWTDGPGRVALWASANAAPTHPQWYRNLAADPHVTLEFGENGEVRRYEGTASTTHGAERDRLFAELHRLHANMAAHQDRTDREIPLVLVEYD